MRVRFWMRFKVERTDSLTRLQRLQLPLQTDAPSLPVAWSLTSPDHMPKLSRPPLLVFRRLETGGQNETRIFILLAPSLPAYSLAVTVLLHLRPQLLEGSGLLWLQLGQALANPPHPGLLLAWGSEVFPLPLGCFTIS